MSIKAVRRGGGFGIPPAHILEALSLREKIHNVKHWKRRHVFNVIFPNEPPASVFNSEDDAETLVKETVLHGKKVNWGCKQGYQTVTLMRHFNQKVERGDMVYFCYCRKKVRFKSDCKLSSVLRMFNLCIRAN